MGKQMDNGVRLGGIHTVDLGSRLWSRLTLAVGLCPGQTPGRGLGLLPRVKLLPESQVAPSGLCCGP